MDIALMGNTLLRLALRQNLVNFPSQVPTLMHPETLAVVARAHEDRMRDASADDKCSYDEIAEEFSFELAAPVWTPARAAHNDHALNAIGGM